MIKYQNEDKTLVIPSALGNFPSVGGGGSDVTRQDVINIVDSAITEYDTEIQVDLEDIRENVSGNTDNIEALSATTENMAQSIGAINTNIEAISAATDNMASNVETLSAATGNIQSNVESISGQTSANTADIAELLLDVNALDGRVSANTEAVQAISGVTGDVASLSAQTTANTAQIEALSAATEDLSATTEDIYNEVFYEEEGERYSYIGDLQDAMEEKQDALEAGDGISLDSPTISVKAGKGLYFKGDGTMEVLPGAGLTFSGNSNALSVKIGDGLAFSGDTLVVSGGSGSGPRVIILNLLTEQERLALYTELAPYRDAPTYTGIQSGFPAQDYAFYYWAGEETSDGWNDGDRGFVPMQLAAIHPDDYGGACFFTGTVKSRQGDNEILWVRYIVTSTGEVDKSTGRNNWDDPVGYFNINADGSVPQGTDRYSFQGRGVIMIKCGDWNRGWVESLSFTDDYMVLHIKGKVQVDGVEYAGYWKWEEGQGAWTTVSFTAV